MNQAPIRHVHLVGVCGTAMGGLAVLLADAGLEVTGSDAKAYPPMSDLLRARGIAIAEGFRPENLEPRPDLVVIGNAMSRGNPEVEATLERRLRYASLAETLKEFFIRGRTSFVVTGTHGKTTTSSLLAWVLESAGRAPGFMIGGVPANFGVGARIGGGSVWVTEGDEYDTAFFDKRSKFVHYLPDCVVVNNIEFDHADIFESVEAIEVSFRRMLNLVPRNGLVVANRDDERVMRVTEGGWAPRKTFGLGGNADWTARDVRDTAEGSVFELVGPTGVTRCRLPLYGRHNVANALAVAAACAYAGLTLEETAGGFASFRGVQRRLQQLPGPVEYTLYDDFAHHPTAIAETLRAVRARHPGATIWALFEPRSNTTVRNFFQRQLAESLADADHVLIAAIHRLEKIPVGERLDVDRLVSDLRAAGADAHYLPDPDAILQRVVENIRPGDVVTLMSNGAFGGLARRLPEALVQTARRGN